MAKTYGQFCSIARALDLVGDRWALLVVRELLLGPCRFTDLRSGLPGIGTNVLATRLRELEAVGVVERRELPVPTPAVIYTLTDRGEQLHEVIAALSRWGAPLLDLDDRRDVIEPRWFALVLAATVAPDALDDGSTLDLTVDDQRFTVTLELNRLVARRATAPAATDQPRISGALADWFAAAKGDRRALSRLEVAGDRTAARRFLTHVPGALASSG